MKIVVLEHPRIFSPRHFNDIANTPLWSCLMGGYVTAALLAAGYQTEYLDASAASCSFENTARKLATNSPDLLCINAVYFWEHTNALFAFLDQLRTMGFKGHVNLFGFFPTLAYAAILKQIAAVDSVAIGECEQAICELADALTRAAKLPSVPGLAVRTADGFVLEKIRPPATDLDIYPFPTRNPEHSGSISILGSRGCYNHCSFCPVPPFYNQGALWRGRRPENIVAEIKALMIDNRREFYFVDPNFIGPGKKGRQRALKLAALLKPLKITFGMETRPNDLDPELLTELCDAGLTSLLLGIESGSTPVLKRLNKSASLSCTENAIAWCRMVGIKPEIGFIMFSPESELNDIGRNFLFLQKNRLLDRLDRTANLLSHCQIVLMGTSGYHAFQSSQRLKPTGVLGFEGQVDFIDPKVAWLAALIVPTCLMVLRTMSQSESPIYWRRTNAPLHKKLNNYIGSLFEKLLQQAQTSAVLPHKAGLKAEIRSRVEQLISDG